MLSPPVAPISSISGETGRDQRATEKTRRSLSAEIKPAAKIGNYTKVTEAETGNSNWTPTVDIVV